jgi:hypothetical protein
MALQQADQAATVLKCRPISMMVQSTCSNVQSTCSNPRLNALTQDRISQRSTKASFLFHHAQPVAFLKPLNGRGPRLVIQHGNQS